MLSLAAGTSEIRRPTENHLLENRSLSVNISSTSFNIQPSLEKDNRLETSVTLTGQCQPQNSPSQKCSSLQTSKSK